MSAAPMPTARNTRTPTAVLRAGMIALLLAAAVPAAHAITLIVDSGTDAASDACADAAPGDCTLRGAILAANAHTGADRIVFDIPTGDASYQTASAHWRLTPATDLPIVTDDLEIDGYSQPGARENGNGPDQGGSDAVLKIELQGTGSGAQTGLYAGNGTPRLTVRGLAVNRFARNITLSAPGPHRIEGCFIGTDITGLSAPVAAGNGIGIDLGGPATIGGTAPAARNVIAGNGYIGIWDRSEVTAPSIVQGNLIGIGSDGDTLPGRQDYGLYVGGAAQGSLIGGRSAAARNLFAGHASNALYVTGGAGHPAGAPVLRVEGNYFGTDWTGSLARPNGLFPQSPAQPQSTINVFRGGRCGVSIGAEAAGAGNLIAHAPAAGIQVATCTGLAMYGNRFRRNRLAIDLSATSNADGVTPDDPDDADEGGNRLQNAPAIVHLTYLDGGTTIALGYRVDSSPAHAAYPLRVDIGFGTGGQPQGVVLADLYTLELAQAVRTVQIPVAALQGQPLVLTATDADGNSSEVASEAIHADDFEP